MSDYESPMSELAAQQSRQVGTNPRYRETGISEGHETIKPARDQSRLDASVSKAHEVLALIDDQVGRLENLLRPVLVESRPVESKSLDGDMHEVAILAQIEGISEHAARILARITDIHERVGI